MSHTTFAIDAWIPDQERMTGVQHYSYRLIQAMKAHTLKEGERVVLYTFQPLKGELAQLPQGWEEKVLRWPPRRGWMSLRVGWEMLRRPPSVLFVPGQGLPMVCPRATVTTIHDLAFARRPDLYDPSTRHRLRRVTKAAVKKATKILVPSLATKQDLIDLYRVTDDRVVVVPLAPSLQLHDSTTSRLHHFLTIGRLESKKNITTLIRAFELFKSRRGIGDPFELLLAGSPGYGYTDIKKYIALSPYKDQIKELGYIDEAQAAQLLQTATAYVFPSWYEGFGIPNLDAMVVGTPLITSDIPAHREVVGDAGLFVPPGDPEAWAHAMERIAREATLREELVAKGRERVKRYTWESTAEKTWAVLRGLV